MRKKKSVQNKRQKPPGLTAKEAGRLSWALVGKIEGHALMQNWFSPIRVWVNTEREVPEKKNGKRGGEIKNRKGCSDFPGPSCTQEERALLAKGERNLKGMSKGDRASLLARMNNSPGKVKRR